MTANERIRLSYSWVPVIIAFVDALVALAACGASPAFLV